MFTLNEQHKQINLENGRKNIPELSCVYLLINKNTQQFYIGYTTNLKNRLGFYGKSKGGYYFLETPNNFNCYIIHEDTDIRKLMKLESQLIIQYQKDPLIYNKTRKILDIPPILLKESTKKLFLSKINITTDNECWNWMGRKGRGDDQYGKFDIQNGQRYYFVAHRLAYYYFKNEWAGYLLVRHKCNNKLCCNPNHLVLGTDQENSQDAAKDGLLSNKNPNQYKSRFTKDDVEKMIKMRQERKTMNEIAKSFNLGKRGSSLICNILNGKVKTLKKYLGDFNNSVYGVNGRIKCGKKRDKKSIEEIKSQQKEYQKKYILKNKDKIKNKITQKQTKIILNWLANYSYLFSGDYIDSGCAKIKQDVKNIIKFSSNLFEKVAIENNYVYECISEYDSSNGKVEYRYYRFK